MDYQFQIGDRVALTEEHYLYDELSIHTGYVVEETDADGYVAVEFDETHEMMHDCQGRARPGHGYYVPGDFLIPCTETEDGIAPPAGIFDIL